MTAHRQVRSSAAAWKGGARVLAVAPPRDFDVSPYFQIVKPGLTDNFNHRLLDWIDLVRDAATGHFVEETSNRKMALE